MLIKEQIKLLIFCNFVKINVEHKIKGVMHMSFVVTNDWLKEKLDDEDNDELVIVDTRASLTDEKLGKNLYRVSHIPTAVHLDLTEDLAGERKTHGGRNPLPDLDVFIKKIESIGVSNDTEVVIYDEDGGMFASRAWFLFHLVGHENVYVLEGGYKAWMGKGYDITNEIEPVLKGSFTPNILENAVVEMEDVKARAKADGTVLIDSRPRARYLGEGEELDPKAGHIPGAKNYFWRNVLREDGTWKSPEELEEVFADLNKDEEIIVSCGSGISACPNVLSLKTIGFKNVKLYPGSFSDWISYEDNVVETKEE